MRPRARRPLAGLALVLLIVTTAPLSARAQQPAGWRAAVGGLLADRARAVIGGDQRAFDATMSLAPKAFRTAKDTWLTRIRAIGLTSYTLAFDANAYDDLASGLAVRPAADEVHVATVLEQVTFKTFDATPTADDVYFTVIRRGRTWSIYADDGLDGLGLLSVRNVWDFGTVGRAARGNVLVLYQDDRATAQRILTATIAAIQYDTGKWPLPWPKQIVVVIPRSTKDLSRILQTTFDLGPFVAFSSASLARPGGEYRLTGSRVYVQPGTFFSTPVSFQQDTLSHEMLHVSTRGYAGDFTPSFMDEGDAQVYGQRGLPSPIDIRARVSRGTFTGHLPKSFDFSLGSPDDIHLAYEEAASFISYLIVRFGRDAGAKLYRALGNESPVSFGTARYHLDHAVRAAFGVGFDALESAWAQRVRKGII